MSSHLLPVNEVRRALLADEISLRGPSASFAEAIAFADLKTREYAQQNWSSVELAARTHVVQDALPVSPIQDAPDYITDSFGRFTRHMVVGTGRLLGDDVDLEQVEATVPLLFDEFAAVSTILKYTAADFRRTRHASLAFSPEDAREFTLRAAEAGYQPVQTKVLANKGNPYDALKRASVHVAEITELGLNLSDGLARSLAVHRKNPVEAAKEAAKTTDRIWMRYKDDKIVTLSDIRDAVANNHIDKAEDAVDEFRRQVLDVIINYASHPIVNLHTARAACRRSKDPKKHLDTMIQRYGDLLEEFDDIKQPMAVYLARTYADPVAVFKRVKEVVRLDPYQGAQSPRSRENALWSAIHNLTRVPEIETIQ